MTDESQEHSVRSPSSAHRWRRCAGAINAERGLPDRVGVEAAEGTLFHEHAELALRLGLEPHNFKTGLMQTVSGHKVAYNDEMIEHMRGGLDFIYSILDRHPDAILFVETKVIIEPWTLEPGGKGTSDVIIIIPSLRKIIIFDWKYGKIPVSPVENDQATLYALGVWNTVAAKIFGNDPTEIEVEIVIWQPRIPGGGGIWTTTMDALLEEGEVIKAQAEATYDPKALRTPGTKQCMYCKFSGRCPELAAYNLEQYSLRFEDLDDGIEWGVEPPEPDFEDWTPERRSYVLLHWKVFKRWHDRLKEAAMRDYIEGKPVPFMKMVGGNQGHRFFKPGELETVKDLLIEHVGEEAIVETVISPAQAEKKLGKKAFKTVFGEYVDQPPGKPTLVPETDPRKAIPAFTDRFESLFDDEEEDE